MSDSDRISAIIADWAVTGGSELANTQSFVNGLCALVGVDPHRALFRNPHCAGLLHRAADGASAYR